MISKITKTVFNESNSIRLVQNELEKNNRMKTFFSENDRTPFLCEKSSGLDLAQYIEEYSDDALGYGLYVLKKALAMNPEDRYVSIKKLQEDILIWQKEECLHPSRINLALAGSRDQFYKRGERRKPR